MRKCANCGKPITDRKTGKYGNLNTKYCLQCMTEICPVCGTEFRLSPSRGTRKFLYGQKEFCCSRKCAGKLVRKRTSGEKNPNWKEIDWRKFRELYYHEDLSLVKVAEKLNVSCNTLRNRLKIKGFSTIKREGKRSSQWKGGKMIVDGYIVLSKFLLSPKDRKLAESMIAKHALKNHIREHRLVAAKKIGRPLQSNEIVHHLNGIKDDNRPENLVVISPNIHSKLIPIFQKKIRELEKLLYFIN